MTYERRAILSLVAMGRITAAEAERLIAAWQDTREFVWIAAACIAACALHAHPHLSLDGLANLVHAVLNHGTRALHTAASIGFRKMGGSV
jgi:hypothetical protein